MQPYIPYVVLEALVAERVQEAQGLHSREPAFRIGAALHQQLGAILVRLGTWLQASGPGPVPRAA